MPGTPEQPACSMAERECVHSVNAKCLLKYAASLQFDHGAPTCGSALQTACPATERTNNGWSFVYSVVFSMGLCKESSHTLTLHKAPMAHAKADAGSCPTPHCEPTLTAGSRHALRWQAQCGPCQTQAQYNAGVWQGPRRTARPATCAWRRAPSAYRSWRLSSRPPSRCSCTAGTSARP